MMSMWERESPVTGEAQVGIRLTMSTRPRCEPVSPCAGVAQVKTRVDRSGWVTVSVQYNHILMLPRWVPETQGPGEPQVGPDT